MIIVSNKIYKFGYLFLLTACTNTVTPEVSVESNVSTLQTNPTKIAENSTIKPEEIGLVEPSDWSFDCISDKMTDEKYCSIVARKGRYSYDDKHVTVNVSRKSLFIIGEIYPNTSAMIRVDKNKAFTSSHYSDDVIDFPYPSLINQMKSGKKILVKYTVWPENYGRVFEISLDGFTKLYEENKRSITK
jgi:hypothetical protein